MTSYDQLTQAAFEGDVAKLARLLDARVAIHAQDCTQPDALHAAIENDQVECVRLLLARGADPNRATSGSTALAHAVEENNERPFAAGIVVVGHVYNARLFFAFGMSSKRQESGAG